MGQPNFGQLPAHPVAQHFHNDIDAVDGDATEGVHYGLLAELEPKPKPGDPFGYRWRVPFYGCITHLIC